MTPKQQAQCEQMPQLVGKTISGCYRDGTPYPKEGLRILGFFALLDSHDPESDMFCFHVVHAHPLMRHATFRVSFPYQIAVALMNKKTSVWRGREWRVISDVPPPEEE